MRKGAPIREADLLCSAMCNIGLYNMLFTNTTNRCLNLRIIVCLVTSADGHHFQHRKSILSTPQWTQKAPSMINRKTHKIHTRTEQQPKDDVKSQFTNHQGTLCRQTIRAPTQSPTNWHCCFSEVRVFLRKWSLKCAGSSWFPSNYQNRVRNFHFAVSFIEGILGVDWGTQRTTAVFVGPL